MEFAPENVMGPEMFDKIERLYIIGEEGRVCSNAKG